MTSPTVGQVMLDYSVRAESAAGALRNGLQILDGARGVVALGSLDEVDEDLTAVRRLILDALAKIESRTALTGAPQQ
jgi:hypothetical protein